MPTPVPITAKHGIIRNKNPYERPSGSFYQLTNARLVEGRDKVEQTPYFYSGTSWSAGSYYNGGTVTESSDTPASLLLNINSIVYSFSRETARVNGTQVQVIRQTTTPALTNINTHCLVVVNSATGLALTLGSTLDIVIDGATTFKWRKNAGAYTTVVPITTTGVSIDGGNATVYFLIATGFSVNDTWSWTRTDRLEESGANMTRLYDWSYALSTVAGSQRIYFTDTSGRVMMYTQTGGCVVSVGYRPVYGTHVAIYYEHLFVGTYTTGQAGSGSLGITTNIVGNSDVTDLDNFWSTDVNEADTKLLTPATIVNNSQDANGVCGMSVINGILFVYTSTRIWNTGYNGLPVPFSFQEYRKVAIQPIFARPISTPKGDYIVTRRGLEIFDGTDLQLVSSALLDYELVTNGHLIWGSYDATRNEVYMFNNRGESSPGGEAGARGFWIYQERISEWYYRVADFSNNNNLVRAMMVANDVVRLSHPLSILYEDQGGSQNTLVKEYNSGASFQLPTLESNDMVFNDISRVVDMEGQYFDAFYVAPAGTAYGTIGITLEFDNRTYPGSATTYPAARKGTWTTASTDGSLSVHCAGRLWRFRVKPTVSAGKATFGFEFNSLVMQMTGLPNPDITR